MLDRPWAPAICWALALVAYWVLSTRIGLGLVPRGAARQLALQFIWGLISLLLILPAVFGRQDRGLIRRLLRNRVVQWLGVVSYGLYLWHTVWIDKYFSWTHDRLGHANFLRLLAFTVALTVVASALSWVLVEKPVLRFKDRPLLARRGARAGARAI